MNPRASDKVRGFQDTIIVVGDVRVALKLGATLGTDNYCNLILWRIITLLPSSLVKRVALLILPGPAKFTGTTLTL